MTQPGAEPLYNTAAVVRRTGVPAETFRSWERRYGAPKPARDAKGQRLYSERDVSTIRWLADQTTQGVATSRAVEMLRRGYAAPALEAARALGPRPPDDLQADLLRALLEFAGERAEHFLSEALTLHPLDVVCGAILRPLMVRVGELWHAGMLTVTEEHFASGFVRARLLSLLRLYERGAASPLVFAACAPGEWHENGLLMVSVLLARDGLRVAYLGPNVPLESLAGPVQRLNPDVLIVSAALPETAVGLRDAGGLLASLPESRPALAFGGRAFDDEPGLRAVVPGTYLDADLELARRAVLQLISTSARAA